MKRALAFVVAALTGIATSESIAEVLAEGGQKAEPAPVVRLAAQLKSAFGEDNRFVREILGGMETRFGVIVPNPKAKGRTDLPRYQLLKTLARKSSADGAGQLVILAFYSVKQDMAAKIERNAIDVATIANLHDIVSQEDLIVWNGEALWCVRKDGRWWIKAREDHMIRGTEDGDAQLTLTDLSPSALSFKIHFPTTLPPYDVYFAIVDDRFEQVFYHGTSFHGLDECKKYPGGDQYDANRGNESDDEWADTPNFPCANVNVTPKVLTSKTNDFYDLEVKVEGEARNRVRHSKRYYPRYSKEYGHYIIDAEKTEDPAEAFIQEELQ